MAETSESQLTTKNLEKFNFFYSFRPVYYFSRTFGFLPFSIVYDSNGSIQIPKIRVFDSLWFTIAMSVYILSAVIVLQNTESPEDGSNIESVILKITDYILLVSMLFFGAVIIGMDMINRFKLVEILKDINTFDEEVGKRDEKKLTTLIFNFHCCLYAGDKNWDFFQL